MAERGVLFSGPMVRALIAGTKTQTRRGIVMPSRRGHSEFGRSDTAGYDWHFRDKGLRWNDVKHERLLELLQHRVGDQLYVREHWRTVGAARMLDEVAPRDLEPQAVWYVADGAAPDNEFAGRFRQGMHMPRWASRLTLTVTDVRVERLQDISEADAIAEGVTIVGGNAILTYFGLWDSINGASSWDANPWVAAYTFTVQRGNIDAPA